MLQQLLIRIGIGFFAIESRLIAIFLKLMGVRVGRGVRFNGIPYVRVASGSRITIGDNVTINSSFLCNPAGLNHRTILFTLPGAEILIGNNVGVSGVTIYSATSIHIGNNVLLGANVVLYDTDFHQLNPLDRRAGIQDSIRTSPVVIEDDVFIGANSIILKGSRIGKGSVIGAGSVVTKDVPPFAVAAGNPARVIKLQGQYDY